MAKVKQIKNKQKNQNDDNAKELLKNPAIAKLLEPSKAEQYIILPCIFIVTFLVAMIPGFYYDDFKLYKPSEQPIAYQIDSIESFPRQIIGPIVVVTYAYFIIQTGGDIIQTLLYSLLLSFDRSFITMLSLSISTAIVPFMILMAFIYSQKILKLAVYSKKWYLTCFFSWCCLLLGIILRAECFGPTIGIFCASFISALSEYVGGKGTKTKKAMKMIFSIYGMSVPLLFAFIFIRQGIGQTPYIYEPFNLDKFGQEFDKHESLFTALACFAGLVLIRLLKPRYINVVPLIQSGVGAIATLAIPYVTPGNPIEMQLLLVKLLLFIFSGVIITHLKSEWPAYLVNITLILSKGYEIALIIAKYLKQ